MNSIEVVRGNDNDGVGSEIVDGNVHEIVSLPNVKLFLRDSLDAALGDDGSVGAAIDRLVLGQEKAFEIGLLRRRQNQGRRRAEGGMAGEVVGDGVEVIAVIRGNMDHTAGNQPGSQAVQKDRADKPAMVMAAFGPGIGKEKGAGVDGMGGQEIKQRVIRITAP